MPLRDGPDTGIVVRQIALHCCARLVLLARQGKQHRPKKSHEHKFGSSSFSPLNPYKRLLIVLQHAEGDGLGEIEHWPCAPGDVWTEPHRLVGIGEGLFRLADKIVGHGQTTQNVVWGYRN